MLYFSLFHAKIPANQIIAPLSVEYTFFIGLRNTESLIFDGQYSFRYSHNLSLQETHHAIPIVLAQYWIAALVNFLTKTSTTDS